MNIENLIRVNQVIIFSTVKFAGITFRVTALIPNGENETIVCGDDLRGARHRRTDVIRLILSNDNFVEVI